MKYVLRIVVVGEYAGYTLGFHRLMGMGLGVGIPDLLVVLLL